MKYNKPVAKKKPSYQKAGPSEGRTVGVQGDQGFDGNWRGRPRVTKDYNNDLGITQPGGTLSPYEINKIAPLATHTTPPMVRGFDYPPHWKARPMSRVLPRVIGDDGLTKSPAEIEREMRALRGQPPLYNDNQPYGGESTNQELGGPSAQTGQTPGPTNQAPVTPEEAPKATTPDGDLSDNLKTPPKGNPKPRPNISPKDPPAWKDFAQIFWDGGNGGNGGLGDIILDKINAIAPPPGNERFGAEWFVEPDFGGGTVVAGINIPIGGKPTGNKPPPSYNPTSYYRALLAAWQAWTGDFAEWYGDLQATQNELLRDYQAGAIDLDQLQSDIAGIKDSMAGASDALDAARKAFQDNWQKVQDHYGQ